MPNTVQYPIVAFGLQKTVDENARYGQYEAGQIEFEKYFSTRVKFTLGDAYFNPGHYCYANSYREEHDKCNIAESVVQVDGHASEQTHEKCKHFPGSHKRRHGQYRDHKRRVGAYEIGQLQAVVVEYTK